MEVQKNNNSLYVAIGSVMDLGRFSQFSTNAKIEELKKPNGYIYFQVENLEAASKLCRQFIHEFNLGGSNWIV